MIKNGEHYLITTNNWFYAPDGHVYRSVWGVASICEFKKTTGFDIGRQHSTFYVEIGECAKQVVVAGCQVLYAMRCDERPAVRPGVRKDSDGNESPVNDIYFAE